MFNDCNLRELRSYLMSGGGKCLFNMPNTRVMYGGQRCGNGYLEDGEECDCGDEEVLYWPLSSTNFSVLCRFSCPVALPHLLSLQECTSPCCNANNCTLKAGAECAHGVCCQDCKVCSPLLQSPPTLCISRSPLPSSLYVRPAEEPRRAVPRPLGVM